MILSCYLWSSQSRKYQKPHEDSLPLVIFVSMLVFVEVSIVHKPLSEANKLDSFSKVNPEGLSVVKTLAGLHPRT